MSSPPLSECPIQRDLALRSEGGLFSPTLTPCFYLILPPCFCLILPLFHPTLVHALGSALIPPQSTQPPSSEACLVSIPFDTKYTFRPAPTAYSSSRLGTSPPLLHPPHALSASLATRGTSTSPFISSRISDQAEGTQSGSLSTPAERRHKSPEAVHHFTGCTASGL